ncbi:MAG: hypothetical protein JNL18_13095 [Planctomycetaceae bacterium]|nr:hypothetical protein [Planctomycetaceae bacterium]
MRRTTLSTACLATAVIALGACRSFNGNRAIDLRPGAGQKDAAAYLAHPTTVGQLVFHADFILPSENRLIDEIVAERQIIYEKLRLKPSDRQIHVHLFADETDYKRHVSRRFPGFPERRAIFVQTDRELAVYATWGEAVAEDLRHEVAHGYLHASVPNLPLWLDEGLAEYFEVSRGRDGVNRLHVDYLRGQLAVGGWRPNLPRLEQLIEAGELTQLDYAESWLWVHFLLHSEAGRETLLTGYLASLRPGEPAGSLADWVKASVENPHEAVLTYLRGLPK